MRSKSLRHSLANDPADIKAFRMLLPYLREYRGRLVLAFSFLIFAKLANVSVPLVLKQIIDGLNQPKALLIVPTFLLIGYGLLRLSMTLFTDLRDVIFARVTQRAIRRVALEVFQHLHALSLRFHLERQTGGVSRDIERGTRGIESLMRFLIFSIFPTLLEMALVGVILVTQYDIWFALITLGTLVIYIVLTVSITEWRTKFRRAMNEMDSKANTKAIDSLLNYETVKYFGNEEFEAHRYDDNLQRWENASVRSQTSLAGLNITQSAVIAIGVTLLPVAGGRWRSEAYDDAWRLGADQYADDPALHSAQLPRYGVSRDQAVARRHGEDVQVAQRQRRDPR
jgi:ATP-binding cassette subfamily B protein